MTIRLFIISIAYIVALAFQAMTISTVSANANLWQSLNSGDHFVLMRHALAPGFGDPDNFIIKDCSTQRNLNNEGRNQARAIGNIFRSHGIDGAIVYSSQWCRCLDTAKFLELGPVMELVSLNSFFEYFDRKKAQTGAIMQWITKLPLTYPAVLVTHQVNIIALTGLSPASGEMIFVKRRPNGMLSIIGTIKTLE